MAAKDLENPGVVRDMSGARFEPFRVSHTAGEEGRRFGVRFSVMADPVSWLGIEHGWHVFASGGEEIGSVHEVTGDKTADIFDGLAVRFGRSGPTRYVPAEQVGEILPDRVMLLLTVAEADALDHFEKPAPEITITAEKAPWWARVGAWFRRKPYS